MTSDGLIILLSGHRFGFSTYLLKFLVFCIRHTLFAFFTLKTRNKSRTGPLHLSAKNINHAHCSWSSGSVIVVLLAETGAIASFLNKCHQEGT